MPHQRSATVLQMCKRVMLIAKPRLDEHVNMFLVQSANLRFEIWLHVALDTERNHSNKCRSLGNAQMCVRGLQKISASNLRIGERFQSSYRHASLIFPT